MSEGTLQKEEEEVGCGEEAKRQVQHISIMLRWLWRSNEQPRWFTVQAGGERKKQLSEGEEKDRWDEWKRLLRWIKAGMGNKNEELKAVKKQINKKKKRTEGIENNKESQSWYSLLT